MVYSYGMYGDRKTEKGENFPEDFPIYNIYADRPWNYALLSQDPKDYRFEKRIATGNPWDIRYTPFVIKTKAVQIDGWDLKHYREILVDEPENNHTPPKRKRIKRECTLTPLLPTEKMLQNSSANKPCEIELVPYATAKLRITVFPTL